MKAQRLLEKIQKKYNQSIELYLLSQHLQTSNKEQSTLFRQIATNSLEKYGLAQKIYQIIKLESIKSQLKYIHILKKTKNIAVQKF